MMIGERSRNIRDKGGKIVKTYEKRWKSMKISEESMNIYEKAMKIN